MNPMEDADRMIQIEEVFRKREEEYQQAEENFKNRRAELNQFSAELEEKRNMLSELEKKLLADQAALNVKEEQLSKKFQDLEDKEKSFDAFQKEAMININIMKAKLQNKKLEAARIKDEETVLGINDHFSGVGTLEHEFVLQE